MLSFLLTATSTWALWKVLDAWLYSGRERCGAISGESVDCIRLDNAAVARELASLHDPQSRCRQALQSILGTEALHPGGLNDGVARVYRCLTPEERAAVSLVLVIAGRQAGLPAQV